MRLPSLLDHIFGQGCGIETGLRVLASQEVGIVVLRQEVIGALLACSLFCLFAVANRDALHLPTINFNYLFGSLGRAQRPSQEHKILCLKHYFERICLSMPSGYVSFQQKVLPLEHPTASYPDTDFWSNSSVSLCPFEIMHSGLTEDQQRGAIEVDFANKIIGGGALYTGCVREEIRFVINPEIIAAMIFLPAMVYNEAVEIVGVERFSSYGEYASSFQFLGDYQYDRPVDSMGRRKTRIVAIDALDDPRNRQFSAKGLLRELNKAFCWFLHQPIKEVSKKVKPLVWFGPASFAVQASGPPFTFVFVSGERRPAERALFCRVWWSEQGGIAVQRCLLLLGLWRGTMVDPRPRRAFLKMQPPEWKDKLRQKCLERMQDNRGRFLWKTRTNGKKVVIQKEAMECALRDIVSDELRRIWQTPPVNKAPCLSTSEAHDSIWEYNGPNLEFGFAERESEVLDEEIMIEMDKVLHEQLESEISQRELEDMERLHEEEDDYLAQAVYEQMQLDGQGEGDGKVWCPICKQGEVQENRRFIYCTCCNLLFDNLSDQVNLNVLRHRLAEVHAVHLDRGCKAVPKFTMETKFNLSALYIYCQACNTFEIVL